MVNYTYFQKRMGLLNLTADQTEQLHLATLDILEQVGVKVLEPEALELLRGAGARVSDNLVKIQPWMVQQALQTTPCKIAIYDRSGKRAMTLERAEYITAPDLIPPT